MSTSQQTQITPIGSLTPPPKKSFSGFIWRKPSSTEMDADLPKLAPADGYWFYLKVAVFGLFTFYNVTFFWQNTQGWLKYVTSISAVLLEVTAFLCTMWWSRTTGKHRFALFAFGIAFILISVSHATIAYYQMMGGTGEYENWMSYYLHVVAFPLIFGGLGAASIIAPSLHWEKEYVREQIRNEIEIERSLAQLRTKMTILESQARFKEAEEKALRRMMSIRQRRLNTVKNAMVIRQEEDSFIRSFPDPYMRAEAQKLLSADQLTLDSISKPNPNPDPGMNEWPDSLPN